MAAQSDQQTSGHELVITYDSSSWRLCADLICHEPSGAACRPGGAECAAQSDMAEDGVDACGDHDGKLASVPVIIEFSLGVPGGYWTWSVPAEVA